MSFSRPNGTVIPDEFFDYWLPHLNSSELRVLCYLMRRTFGFKRHSDLISLQQFMHGIKTHDGRQLDYGCGVTNKTTITKALRGLQDKDLVTIVKRVTIVGDSDVTLYALKVAGDPLDYSLEALTGTYGGGGDKTGPPRNVGTKLDHGGDKTKPQVGTKLDPQIDSPTNNSEQQTEDTPLTPHGRGEQGRGAASSPLHQRDEGPPLHGAPAASERGGVLSACAALLNLPYDRSFRLMWADMITDAVREGEPGTDIVGCLRWMLSDPSQYWQKNPQHMGPGAVLRKLSVWRGQGSPATHRPVAPPKKAAPSHQQPAAALSTPDAYSGGRFGLCQICGSRPCAPDCPQQEHPDPRAAGLPPFSTRGEGS